MKGCEDIVRSLIVAMQNVLGEGSFSDSCAEQVEMQIRNEYGGQAVYIAKLDRDARRESVLRDFNGKNRKELCAKHGLSKAQFYRMLKGE